MFNNLIITGRITADPELKTTSNGTTFCSFTIANDTGYGETKKTNFIPVIAWKNRAEIIVKYFSRGSLIGIEGQLQSRKYEDKDGKSHTVLEVIASDIQFMEKKSDATDKDSKPAPDEQFATVADDAELPF